MIDDPNQPHGTEVKPLPPPAPLRRGSRFTPGAMPVGRFRIIALLGRGGTCYA